MSGLAHHRIEADGPVRGRHGDRHSKTWGFQVSDCWPHKEQGANNPGIKKKELEMTEFETTGDAANEISPYVRNDNVERKHSAIEYLTPAQFEQLNQRSK